jgi:hypothetical protein
MDVKLPNGQVIRGVPDGTSKDDIMDKAISASLATEQDFTQSLTTEQDIGGVVNHLASGLTLGFNDELEGALDATLNPPGFGEGYLDNWGDRYDSARDNIRDSQAAYKEERPIVSTVAEITGALSTALIPAAHIAKGSSALKATAQLADVGGIEGGITGAGTSNKQGNDLLKDSANGFATAAILAPLIGGSFNVAADGLSTLGKVLGNNRVGEFLAGKYDVRARNELKKWAKSNNIKQDELNVITEQMRTLKAQTNAGVSLADVDDPYIQTLNLGLNKQSPLPPSQVQSLNRRASDAKVNFQEIVDPTYKVGDNLNGLDLNQQSLIPNGSPNQGIVDLTQHGRDAINASNQQAKGYYDVAY